MKPEHSFGVIVELMTSQLTLDEVKERLAELVHRVSSERERVTVTVHGEPCAILLAPEDLAALEETIAVLSDPDALRRLEASERELAEGLGESEADLAAAMALRRTIGA
jgi:antitoxin YefM